MTRSAWWLVCDSVAVYRLSQLVVHDKIMAPFREAVRSAGWIGEGIQIGSLPGRCARWLYELISCMWCLSIWWAAVVVALTRFVPGGWQYVAAGLTLSGVTGYLSER